MGPVFHGSSGFLAVGRVVIYTVLVCLRHQVASGHMPMVAPPSSRMMPTPTRFSNRIAGKRFPQSSGWVLQPLELPHSHVE
jgi:hypothetical protein